MPETFEMPVFNAQDVSIGSIEIPSEVIAAASKVYDWMKKQEHQGNSVQSLHGLTLTGKAVKYDA